MMDWTTNQPNARFWVLKLIKDSFHPATQWWKPTWASPSRSGGASFITPAGRKLLLVNKSDLAAEVPLPMLAGPAR